SQSLGHLLEGHLVPEAEVEDSAVRFKEAGERSAKGRGLVAALDELRGRVGNAVGLSIGIDARSFAGQLTLGCEDISPAGVLNVIAQNSPHAIAKILDALSLEGVERLQALDEGLLNQIRG